MREEDSAERGNPTVIAAIIQARTGSTRLPGKVLADIGGKTMLQRVIDRVQAAASLDKVIVATTLEEDDNALADLTAGLGVAVYRGSTNDVLDRYYQAAKASNIDVIVRITADCPLMDPSVIDRAIKPFAEGNWDYVSTSYPVPTFPDGLDVEVFPLEVLERAWNEASLPSEREHVTPYIWTNPHLFSLSSIVNPEDLSAMRWTVDEEDDLRFVRQVYQYLDDGTGRIFGMNEVLDLLNRSPEILGINRGIRRNEGYEKSLREDTIISVPRQQASPVDEN